MPVRNSLKSVLPHSAIKSCINGGQSTGGQLLFHLDGLRINNHPAFYVLFRV